MTYTAARKDTTGDVYLYRDGKAIPSYYAPAGMPPDTVRALGQMTAAKLDTTQAAKAIARTEAVAQLLEKEQRAS